MMHDIAWQSFEHGTEADLESFLISASSSNGPVRIILAGEHWGLRACRIIAAGSACIDLRVVFLRGASIGDEGIEILTSSRVLTTTRHLGIERCGLTDRGVRLLAQSPHWINLHELYLCNRDGIESGSLNQIGDEGVLAIAASANLIHLEKLDLWNTGVGDRGLEGLVTSPNLPWLANINAWGTRLTSEGARRCKALANEQWASRQGTAESAAHCWIDTDYDERIITYE
ncbi:MAG TPA: hypothetical protein VMP08_09490 [Anaerolineae bacterium]|nr:hypothetical protein [Anaerolineae bacterium]